MDSPTSTSPSNPIKRKRKPSQTSKTNSAYRSLLNTQIHSLTDQLPLKPALPPSQIGLTRWTSLEKSRFFNALDRLGKHNIPGIAKEIGKGKSVLEVREYILLLEKGIGELKGREEVGMEEIPAATEVSGGLEGVLDRLGGVLEGVERGWEEMRERETWGEEWLVDLEAAGRLEEKGRVRSLSRNDRDEREDEDEDDENSAQGEEVLLKAAELLRPLNFLALSTHLFMNTSSPISDNWQSIISEESSEQDGPSMRATAFMDFHNLTLSLTRRIVSTAYFCANSRLRAISVVGKRPQKRVVRAKDVRAALRMLGLEGMKGGKEKWWDEMVRRCRVVVLEDGEGDGEMLDSLDDPETVENRESDSDTDEDDLDGEDINDDEDQPVEILPKSKPRKRHPQEPEEDSPSEFSDPNNSDENDQNPQSPSSTLSEDAYIEALDIYHSHLEESHLWNILNLDPPEHISNTNPPKPVKRKTKKGDGEVGEVGNWRDSLEYWSQWEVMDLPVREEEFLEIEKRREERDEEDEAVEEERRPKRMKSHAVSDERVHESDLDDDEDQGEEEGGEMDYGDEVEQEDEVGNEDEVEESNEVERSEGDMDVDE